MFACDVFEITGDAHRATRIGDRHFVANVLCRVKDHLLQFTCEMVDCALRTIRTRLACSRCTPAATVNRTNSRPGRCWLSAQGPSGVQIAEELLRAGRRVYLSRLTQGPSGNRPRVIFGLELVVYSPPSGRRTGMPLAFAIVSTPSSMT